MKKIFACGFISFSLAFCTITACAQDSTNTGQKVKKAVKKTGKAIGKGAKKVDGNLE